MRGNQLSLSDSLEIKGVASLDSDSNLRQHVDHRMTIWEGVVVASKAPLATPPLLQYHAPEKVAWIVKDVHVWPSLGIATLDGDTLIKETVHGPIRVSELLRKGPYRTSGQRRISGVCTAIECEPWLSNYYHWLIDILPRVYALHHEWFRAVPEIKLLLSKTLSDDERSALEALLPDNVGVEQVAPDTKVSVEQFAVLPFLSGDWAGYLPMEYLRFFRRRLFDRFGIDPESQRTERVFVSRKRASMRWITNEDALARRLESADFASYCLEELAFPAQMDLFSRARTVIAPHGAGLTNLLFATDCGVIEIFPGKPLNHYRLLSAALDLEYANTTGPQKHKDANALAPIDEVMAKLESMEGERGRNNAAADS